jgi:hypothetical protein
MQRMEYMIGMWPVLNNSGNHIWTAKDGVPIIIATRVSLKKPTIIQG